MHAEVHPFLRNAENPTDNVTRWRLVVEKYYKKLEIQNQIEFLLFCRGPVLSGPILTRTHLVFNDCFKFFRKALIISIATL